MASKKKTRTKRADTNPKAPGRTKKRSTRRTKKKLAGELPVPTATFYF